MCFVCLVVMLWFLHCAAIMSIVAWNEFHYFQFMVCILLAIICVSNRFMFMAELVTAKLVTAVTMYMEYLVTAEQSKHRTQFKFSHSIQTSKQ